MKLDITTTEDSVKVVFTKADFDNAENPINTLGDILYVFSAKYFYAIDSFSIPELAIFLSQMVEGKSYVITTRHAWATDGWLEWGT